MKPLVWLATSLQDVRTFPEAARGEIGYQLFRIQLGLDPSDAKSMPAIGSGVKEIRIHRGDEYRVVYIARLPDAVFVLHAFVKKSQRTPKRDIDLAAERLRRLLRSKEGEP